MKLVVRLHLRGGRGYLPTYKVRVTKRRTKEGLKFNLFTSKVSNMSNTGIAYICGLQRLLYQSVGKAKLAYNQRTTETHLVASNDMDNNKHVSHCNEPTGFL